MQYRLGQSDSMPMCKDNGHAMGAVMGTRNNKVQMDSHYGLVAPFRRVLAIVFIYLLLASPLMAAGLELIWAGGSYRISDNDNPSYTLDSFISMGSYNGMYLFSEPSLTLKQGELGVSIGAGMRVPVMGGQAIAGYNIFYDYTDNNNHERIGTGAEMYFRNFSAHINIYLPLSGREGREEALSGMDFTLGIPLPIKDAPSISIWPGFYYFRGEDESDMEGLGIEVHVQPMKVLMVKIGARNDTLSAGEDDSEVYLSVEIKIPMKKLGKDLFSYMHGTYPRDLGSYMDDRVVRERFITYEKKTKPWDVY